MSFNIESLFQWKFTLYGSWLRSFFCRNFSRLGGATSTTYGFKSLARSNFKLCGCKFNTQILPLDTTVRIASRDVPVVFFLMKFQ